MAGVILSIAVLAIGSVSTQQAFAGQLCTCFSQFDGDWDSVFDCGEGFAVPSSSDVVCIFDDDVQLDGEGLASNLVIFDGPLFIGCDGDLTVEEGIIIPPQGSLINHGSVDTFALHIDPGGLAQNSSSAFIGLIFNDGTFENISTICSQPIGGTVGSIGTVSLLVAGAQANMGLWIIALVGVVAVAGIAYKAKTSKEQKEE